VPGPETPPTHPTRLEDDGGANRQVDPVERAAMDKKAKTPQKPKTAKPKDKKAG